MLNWLMGWTIFTYAHRVVRKDENHFCMRERCQPNRRTHVIGENKERSANGKDASMQRHSNHCRRHCMFSNAEVDLLSFRVSCREGFQRTDFYTCVAS